MIRLTLKRSGTFKCNWSEFGNRCGTNPQPVQEYNYECEIETNDALDDHGFIVDQLTVNKTMQTLFFPEPHEPRSCEQMAIYATHKINNIVLESVATIYRIRVSVGVIPPKGSKEHAMISAELT